ncbi:MAG: Lon-like protease [Actinomycetota bacterium]|nr:Lon-like protease [Actinomycetota bacterium]
MRRVFSVVALAVIAAAAVIVPLPVVAIEPGPALPVPPRIKLGIPAHPVHGQLLLTAVRLSEPAAVQAVADWLDPDVELQPRPAVIPPGVRESDYIQAQQRLFRESALVAAAVGLQHAGFPVRLSGGGARVVAVIAGSPADGLLREGDVITAIDGRPVRTASDVAEAAARAVGGQRVTVTFQRGGATGTVTVPLGKVSGLGRPALGVAVDSVDPRIQLPFPVEVDQGDVAGPSAGLMMALTVYELAGGVDLAQGRTIAGTGTIDLAGNVGPVGGVREKVAAARAAKASVFVVPADEAREANDAAGDALAVKPVRTFAEAVDALSIPPVGAILSPEHS